MTNAQRKEIASLIPSISKDRLADVDASVIQPLKFREPLAIKLTGFCEVLFYDEDGNECDQYGFDDDDKFEPEAREFHELYIKCNTGEVATECLEDTEQFKLTDHPVLLRAANRSAGLLLKLARKEGFIQADKIYSELEPKGEILCPKHSVYMNNRPNLTAQKHRLTLARAAFLGFENNSKACYDSYSLDAPFRYINHNLARYIYNSGKVVALEMSTSLLEYEYEYESDDDYVKNEGFREKMRDRLCVDVETGEVALYFRDDGYRCYTKDIEHIYEADRVVTLLGNIGLDYLKRALKKEY